MILRGYLKGHDAIFKLWLDIIQASQYVYNMSHYFYIKKS